MTGSDHIPAVILAGGASQRMGKDKAMLPFAKGTLLAHAVKRLGQQARPVAISRHDAKADAFGSVPVIVDDRPDHDGPLAGILAGLRHFGQAGFSHMASIAVDTPFFPDDYIARLKAEAAAAGEILVARSHGRAHPVFALWPTTLAENLADELAGGNRRLMDFIARHPHRFVDFADEAAGDPFFNINTPDDLETARQRLGILR